MTTWRRDVLVNLVRLSLIAIGLVSWEVAGRVGMVDSFFVSSPLEVAERTREWLSSDRFALDVRTTLRVVSIGWVTAGLLGTAIGFALALNPRAHRLVRPFVDAFNATPRIALVPLFILWLGIGFASHLALILSVNIVVMIIATTSAAVSVDRDLLALVRSLGGNRRDIVSKVILPWSSPGVFAGLRIGLGYALAGGVVAEMLGSRQGIGNFIARASNVLDIAGVMSGVIVVLFFAVLGNIGLRAIENRMLAWSEDRGSVRVF